MPVYNGIEFIDTSVKSVINQTNKDWELIIGVNGHPVNSVVYKKALDISKLDENRIPVIDMIDCKGKSNALNKLLNVVQYSWIALLDVDDEWLPKKLESQLPFTNMYDVLGSHCKYFGDLSIVPNIPLGDISNFNFTTVNPIVNSSCLVKKELCYWDSKYDGVEDYDMWLRLRHNKLKFYNVHTIQVMHRIHNNSAFNANGNNNKKVASLLEKYS